jgi:hypothetical protein
MIPRILFRLPIPWLGLLGVVLALAALFPDVAAAGCPGCCSSHGGISNVCSSSGRIYCNDGTVSPSCLWSSCGVSSPPPPPQGRLYIPATYIVAAAAQVGTTQKSSPIAIINAGLATVDLYGIASSNATEFGVVATTCGASLTPGGSCTFTVAFTPAVVGIRSATISDHEQRHWQPPDGADIGNGRTGPATAIGCDRHRRISLPGF